jgi:predicted transcriptional regulator
MADLTITATNVVPGTGASIQYGIAGETLLAGQALYLKAADGRMWKAECDAAVEAATCAGVALNGASPGQTVGFVSNGTMTIGATTAKTTTYMVSAAAGGICPQVDLVSTNKICIVGVATDTVGTFIVRPFLTGASV